MDGKLTYSQFALPTSVSDPDPTSRKPDPPYLHGPNSALVLVGIFLSILLAGLDALVVATALPTIGASLGNGDDITFVSGAYLIASTVAIPLFSRLSDLYSRRNIFVIALAVFIGGSALAGLSQTLGELILFRGVQGFGSGAFFPVGIAMVAILYPPKVRAQLIGILSAAGGLSIVAGPLLGNYIVSVTTWRWVFYVNLPIGLAAAIVLGIALGPVRPTGTGKLDLAGAGLLVGWVSALMLPLVEVSANLWSWTEPVTLVLLALAGALFVTFVLWELRQKDPVVPLRLLGRRVVAASGGISLVVGIALTAMITLLSVLVGIDLGAGDAFVRDVIYFFALPMIVGAFAGGYLVGRYPYRAVLAPALFVAAAGAFLLTGITASTPLWVLWDGFLPVGGLVLPLLPFGFGSGVGLAGVNILIQNETPRTEVAAGIGIVRFLQSLGGAVGLSLLTVYLAWQTKVLLPSAPSASGDLTAAVGAFDRVFLVLAVLTLAAAVLALFLRGRAAQTETPTPRDGADRATAGLSCRGAPGGALELLAQPEAATGPMVRDGEPVRLVPDRPQ